MPADHQMGTPVGTPDTKLIVIRGNSGSGKSTIARQMQLRHGRGCALVQQDYLRRIVLRERDLPGGIAPALIASTVRFALDHSYHVVLEGILHRAKYGAVLADLRRAHRGRTYAFYLDVCFEETVRRHATRPQATEFTPDEMRAWYQPRDLLGDDLGYDDEHVVAEASSLEDSVAFIAATADLPLTGRDDDHLPAGAAR